ncbi:hypothetical protein RND71_019091 [Anisodus tanguticus]|uniref:Protein TAR1 n=1 Tax=Anisodus tanguticus TaxID=243964 RepID=A0AAE1RZK4_9SOLA|nr:hypothetical protein RND71_019091 [Anisodus tanguticus]
MRSTPKGARALPQSGRRRSRAYREPGFGPPRHAPNPRPESIGGPARRRSTSDRGASPAPIRFPPDNFKHSLTLFSKSFSKSFSSFPRGTCSLSVSRPYLALDGIHRPIWAAFPNNPTRRQRLVVRQGPGTTGLSPSPAPPSRGLGPGPPLRTLLQTTIRTTEPPDSKAGLFPRVIPPDLGSRSERCERKEGGRVRSRARGLRLRAHATSWVTTTTCRDVRRRGPAFRPAASSRRTGGQYPPRDTAASRMAGAACGGAMRDARARRALGLASAASQLARSKTRWFTGFAIHTKYRISLRSSSMREPRYPLPRVVFVSKATHVRRARARGSAGVDSVFLGAFRAGGLVVSRRAARARAGGGREPHGGGAPPRPRARAPPLFQTSSRVVRAARGFDNDPSAGSPTETLLRLLLPLNDKVQWTSRNVAGSEPPASPRSEHFTGSFNR